MLFRLCVTLLLASLFANCYAALNTNAYFEETFLSKLLDEDSNARKERLSSLFANKEKKRPYVLDDEAMAGLSDEKLKAHVEVWQALYKNFESNREKVLKHYTDSLETVSDASLILDLDETLVFTIHLKDDMKDAIIEHLNNRKFIYEYKKISGKNSFQFWILRPHLLDLLIAASKKGFKIYFLTTGSKRHADIITKMIEEKLDERGKQLDFEVASHEKTYRSKYYESSPPKEFELIDQEIQKKIGKYLQKLDKVTFKEPALIFPISGDRAIFIDDKTRNGMFLPSGFVKVRSFELYNENKEDTDEQQMENLAAKLSKAAQDDVLKTIADMIEDGPKNPKAATISEMVKALNTMMGNTNLMMDIDQEFRKWFLFDLTLLSRLIEKAKSLRPGIFPEVQAIPAAPAAQTPPAVSLPPESAGCCTVS